MLINVKFDEKQKKVLDILLKERAMPFLELTSLCDLDDDELEKVVDGLEKQNLIKVSHKDNLFEEMVALNEKKF